MPETNEDTKGERRERKRKKKRYGHKVRGRSVQTLQRIIVERAKGGGGGGVSALKMVMPVLLVRLYVHHADIFP